MPTLQEDTGSEQELKRTHLLFEPSKYVNWVQFVRSKHAVWKISGERTSKGSQKDLSSRKDKLKAQADWEISGVKEKVNGILNQV